MKKHWATHDLKWGLVCGIGITLFQILFCLIFAPKTEGLKAAYLRFNQWDSAHYGDIVDRGYHIPDSPISTLKGEDVHSNRANNTNHPFCAYHRQRAIFG